MQTSSSGGIGLASVLTIVFVVLKLADVIDWSWVWVLSPLWIGGSIGLTILVLVFGGMMYADYNRRIRRP